MWGESHMNKKYLLLAILIGVFFAVFPAEAYKCSPEGSFIEKKLASRSQNVWERFLSDLAMKGIHKFGEPVHEEITNRILGCEGDSNICGEPDYAPENAYFLAGVRWNDDPPFRFEKGHGNFGGCEPGATIRLVTFPRCWANVFKYGEARAEGGARFDTQSSAPLLLRSHFGDMQFLHSMASIGSEPAAVTREKIIMWAEFTWRVALGEFPLSMLVKDVPIKGFSDLFKKNGWSILDLFSLGNPHVRKPRNMSELALGSLLHMVEDSFATGHTDRAVPDPKEMCATTIKEHLVPGKIVEFHFYGKQDKQRHGEDDTRSAFSTHWTSTKPNVIDVGRSLYEYYEKGEKWENVKSYLECIFALDKEARPASAGAEYLR
jgi:hypothetical protein